MRSKLTYLIYLKLFIICFSFVSAPLSAQFYNGSNVTFGKKKIQYKNFKWNYYDHDRYKIYFYQNGQQLAIHTNNVLKEYLPVLEQDFGIQLPNNVQFIIYNTLGDLNQSNIGTIANSYYNTGGIAHIIDKKIFYYFNGDICDFDRQIRAGACKLSLQIYIAGTRLIDRMNYSDDFDESDWFLDGLVSYCTDEWNTKTDDDFKNLFVNGKIKKLKHVEGKYAVITGHSVWKFIHDKYGETSVKAIIFAAKREKNIYDSFKTALGISFSDMEKEWKSFYSNYYSDNTSNSNNNNLIPATKNKKHLSYEKVKVNYDGKFVAYSTNENGLKKLYVKDLASNKTYCVYKTGYRSDTKTDNTFPVLAWHPSRNILAVAVEEHGGVKLFFYNPQESSKNRLFLQNVQFSSMGFEKVLDMIYSPDAQYILFSACKNGQTDLFLWNIVSGVSINLTNDVFNDFNPTFLNRYGDILFSSNRSYDSEMKANNNLFLMNIFDNKSIKKLTDNKDENEILSQTNINGSIYFVSDKNGVYNLYSAQLDSIISFVDTITHYDYFLTSKIVTNFTDNISAFDIHGNTLYLILNNHSVLYSDNNFIPENIYFTDDVFDNRKTKNYSESLEKAIVTNKSPIRSFKDVTSKDYRRDLPTKVAMEPIPDSLWDKIIMEREQLSDIKQQEPPDKWKNYYVEFFVNSLITQLDFSSMNYSYQQFAGGYGPVYLYSGLNILMGAGITDLMEDYRLSGGFNLSMDLMNNEYALSFSDLKKRVDKEFIFHRFTDVSRDYYYATALKQRTHEFMYKLTYPFTNYFHISGTAIIRNNKTLFLDLNNEETLADLPNNINWAGVKAELVFDNSYNLCQNILLGTRWKIFGEYNQSITKENHNLAVVGFDFRNYQRIHRQMIFAWRLACSSSIGTDRLIYYMGGVDNWISPRYDYDNQPSSNINYAYQTLATNMRGFKQNIRNGPNFIVLNTEIRVPVFRYLLNRPISSKLLNSVQLVAFADAGSAWNGINPYGDENALFHHKYDYPPLMIDVMVYKQPLVVGYGAGIRFNLFGYFVRIDYAWGLEDWKIADKGWYFSLNLDF